jgi:hypothetical protein
MVTHKEEQLTNHNITMRMGSAYSMSEHNGEGKVSALPVMPPWTHSLQPHNLQTEFNLEVMI